MMLFRIDNSSEFNGNIRQYGFPETEHIILKGNEIERFIANEISKEINGSNERRLISYSKSLGVCLLKYNKYLDNKLLFSNASSNTRAGYSELYYRKGNQIYCKPYYLQYSLDILPIMEVEIVNFIVDVSDNKIIQNYFQKQLGKGKKPFASPKKDQEVITMRPLEEIIIDADNLETVYILYGLSIKYNFLKDERILNGLINDIYHTVYEGRFTEEEARAIIYLINYMAYYGNYERKLSEAIRERNTISERINFCYDPICEYDAIIRTPSIEEYETNTSFFNTENVITHALRKWCRQFLRLNSY